MKLLCIIAITAGAVTFSPAWQSGAAPNPSQLDSNTASIVGTDVVAELSKSINVKKVKPGDPVKASVTQDVIAQGKIVIRRGSKLLGHVTEAKVRSKGDQESRLGFMFDKALLKGGGEIDLSGALRALAPGVRVGAVDRPDPMGAPPRGPYTQGGSAQPISNTGASIGGSKASSDIGSSGVPAVSTREAVAMSTTSRGPVNGGPQPESGLMGAGSRGVFGLPDLKLNRETGDGPRTVITSTRHNVKLDSGTQMVLQISSAH